MFTIQVLATTEIWKPPYLVYFQPHIFLLHAPPLFSMPPKSRGFLTAPVLYCIIVCCVVFTCVHTCYLTSFSQWRSIYTLSELCYMDIVPWRHVLFICMCTSPAYLSACPPFRYLLIAVKSAVQCLYYP